MRADDLSLLGRIDLGDDADNVRIDSQRGQVLVGYGKGALAVIDPKTRAKLADIPLKATSGKLSDRTGGARAFVNVPDAGLIQVVDLAKGQAIGALPTQGHHANFPMALDNAAHRILVAFRSPARLLVLSTQTGRSSPISTPAAMPMTSLSMRDAIASMSSVVRAPSMCSRTMPALISASARLAPHRELEPACSFLSWTGCLLRSGRPARSRPPSGCSSRRHETLKPRS